MDNALSIAVQAMHNSVSRLNTISHNVANVGTPGFKRTVPLLRSFNAELTDASTSVGAPKSDAALDSSAATPLRTGIPLDLLVEGGAFFELKGSEGVGYSRSGSFRLDPSGKLVNQQGAELQSSGGSLQLSADSVTVMPDGSLQQSGRPAGAIRMVTMPSGTALRMGIDGLLRPIKGNVAISNENIAATIRTGYLESSNVSTVNETVMLMQTSRGFESLTRLHSAYDEQIGTALQKLGEF